MTEQEAFEHWVDTFDGGLVVTNKVIWQVACEWQRSVCNEELVMLRQQVKELEDAADEYKQLHGFAVNGFNRLTEELAALKQNGGNAQEQFSKCCGEEITDPIDRLRFFCSLAMRGQDWLDVEPFFDALTQQGKPGSTDHD